MYTKQIPSLCIAAKVGGRERLEKRVATPPAHFSEDSTTNRLLKVSRLCARGVIEDRGVSTCVQLDCFLSLVSQGIV